jgi:hypothetical protein
MNKILYILYFIFVVSLGMFIIGRVRLINIKNKFTERCVELYGMEKLSDVPAVCYKTFTTKL